jgi:hypothetical protein
LWLIVRYQYWEYVAIIFIIRELILLPKEIDRCTSILHQSTTKGKDSFLRGNLNLCVTEKIRIPQQKYTEPQIRKKKEFILDGTNKNYKRPEYDSLRDKHLKYYFKNKNIIAILYQTGVVRTIITFQYHLGGPIWPYYQEIECTSQNPQCAWKKYG